MRERPIIKRILNPNNPYPPKHRAEGEINPAVPAGRGKDACHHPQYMWIVHREEVPPCPMPRDRESMYCAEHRHP